MHRDQILDTFFDRLRIEGAAAREGDAFVQRDLPRRIVHDFVAFRQPWLDLHGIRVVKQRLADAVADTRPPGVAVVRVDVGLVVFGVECGVTVHKNFFLRIACRCTLTAGKQHRRQNAAQNICNFFPFAVFSLHSVLLLFLQMAPPFPLSSFLLFQRFSHRLYSINSFVYSSFGCSSTSRVVPCSTIFPCRITITRLQSSCTSARSWPIHSIARPSSFCSFFSN